MKLIIVEDEKDARQYIRNIVTSQFKEIEIVGEADSVKVAIEIIKIEMPDILIMDIQLLDGISLQILDKIDFQKVQIIFVTSYSEYAISAFKYAAIDYILKPFETSQLVNALLKIKAQKIESEFSNIKLLLDNLKRNTLAKEIAIQTSEGYTILKINDIIRLESDSNYSMLFYIGAKRVISSKPLSFYNDILLNSNFVRVHQSHLINVFHISKYIHKDGGYLILSDGSSVPVSQRKKTSVIKLIENIHDFKSE
jgi:two-component system, LytTR family, response regulator